MNLPHRLPQHLDAADSATALMLDAIRRGVDDLVTLQAGETVVLERRVLIGPAPGDNPVDLVTPDDEPWHSVLIENPTATPLLLSFAGGGARPGTGRPVPANAAVVYSRPFDVVSVGVDPGANLAAPITVWVTRYKRPMPVAGWRLA